MGGREGSEKPWKEKKEREDEGEGSVQESHLRFHSSIREKTAMFSHAKPQTVICPYAISVKIFDELI